MTMQACRVRRPLLALAGIGVLSACGGTADRRADLDPMFFGALPGEGASNGAAFATGDAPIADLAGRPLTLRLVGQVTDPATGETRLVLSEETFTLDGIVDETTYDGRLTLDGEVLTFADGRAIDAQGRNWDIYVYALLVAGVGYVGPDHLRLATVSSYSYEGNGYDNDAGAPGLDHDLAFLIGHETAPEVVAAMGGSATYSGLAHVYGTELDGDGQPVSYENYFKANIALEVDFGRSEATAFLIGESVFGRFEAETGALPITGNGFAGDLLRTNCPETSTCLSASSLAGVFYGSEGEEIGGLIAIDETEIPGAGDPTRLLGGGGFTAELETD